MTLLAIDIDGTLARRNNQQFLKTCNDVLNLALSEERLQELSSLQAFYQLPEVLAYKQRSGEAHYTKAVGWIDYHPDVLRAMRPLPGAKEGIQTLACLGNISYYTARYSPQSEERSQAMALATFEWLTSYSFLHPASVVFCDGLPGKLWQLAQHIARDTEPVILIDDQCTRLLQRLADLDQDTAHLLQRSLILVAYGAQSAPDCTSIPVVALPSWDDGAVHDVIVTLTRLTRKEPISNGIQRYI